MIDVTEEGRVVYLLKAMKSKLNYLPGKEAMFSVALVCLLVCLSLFLFCWSVSSITQKVMNELR